MGEQLLILIWNVVNTTWFRRYDKEIKVHLGNQSCVWLLGPTLYRRLDFMVFCILQVWEHYKANELVKLIDPMLDMDFRKEEAVRFMKIGLLCVQENTTKRPQMSLTVRMLTKETDLKDHKISQPGHIIDFMDIKMGKGTSSTSIFSKVSTSNSM